MKYRLCGYCLDLICKFSNFCVLISYLQLVKSGFTKKVCDLHKDNIIPSSTDRHVLSVNKWIYRNQNYFFLKNSLTVSHERAPRAVIWNAVEHSGHMSFHIPFKAKSKQIVLVYCTRVNKLCIRKRLKRSHLRTGKPKNE